MKKTERKRAKKPDYAKVFDISDGKINVLVLGTSGSGKSTLINAVLDEELAETGSGSAVTKEITIYNKDEYPLRLIDTVGLEYSRKKQNEIKKELLKFFKDSVKNQKPENLVHAIWLCIDGTVHRIDKEVLNYIRDISKVWKDAPVIVVFTKSYSTNEINENTLMFNNVLDSYRYKDQIAVKMVMPVVAKAYCVADDYIVQPMGIDTLTEATLELGLKGVLGAKNAVRELDLKAKRAMSYSLVAATSVTAATVGAVPVPVQDAVILVPLQSAMITGLSTIYKIKKGDASNKIVQAILEAGAVSALAKTVLNSLKAIPGLTVAAAVLNAAVAGVFTFIIGEVSIELLERTYTGELDLTNADWVKEAEELLNKYVPSILQAVGIELEEQKANVSPATIAEIIKGIRSNLAKQK